MGKDWTVPVATVASLMEDNYPVGCRYCRIEVPARDGIFVVRCGETEAFYCSHDCLCNDAQRGLP